MDVDETSIYQYDENGSIKRNRYANRKKKDKHVNQVPWPSVSRAENYVGLNLNLMNFIYLFIFLSAVTDVVIKNTETADWRGVERSFKK